MQQAAPAPPARGWAGVKLILEMIRWEHTVFALPFALVAALMAAQGIPELRTLFWIVVAMVGARSSAMAFNRLVDQRYDAANPRTQSRALPAGALSRMQVWLFTFAGAALLLLAAAQLNSLALALSPVALVIIWGYSLTKRVSELCHLFLGLAIGIAPPGAWIAVTGRLDAPAVLLSAGVLCWVAGFDIIYALQDLEFDRGAGLHSVPARLGAARALALSRLLHVACLPLLGAAGWLTGAGPFYWVGLAAVALLLAWEQSLVAPDDLSRVDAAFFTVNGFISLGFFVAVLLDQLL